MSFLKNVKSLVENYTPNEITPRNLSTPDPNDPNKTLNFGFLGDYAKNVDQKAQRSYIETGYIRNVRPRKREIIIQEPTATILVKKRMFSSLTENYRGEYMDEGEKLFMKASAKLFESKCQAIALYEKLTKIDKVVEAQGVLDPNLVPVIITLLDSLSFLPIPGLNSDYTKSVLTKLKQINEYSKSNNFTSWINYNDNYFTNVTGIGAGTGVMEFASFSSISTSVTVNGEGSCNLSFEDPYNLMRVTEQDIDAALADSVSTKSNNFYNQSERTLSSATENLKLKLRKLRNARGASDITIRISDDSILYKRLSAFFTKPDREVLFSFNSGDNVGSVIAQIFTGMNVEFDSSALESPTNPQGLNPSEKKTLEQILVNCLELINIRKRRELSLDQIEVRDPDLKNRIDYVLRQMRLHYHGKHIIQHMDVVHVYMTSKTETISDYGNELTKNGNILAQLDKNVGNFKKKLNDITSLFSATRTEFQEIEKNAVVGPEFPDWLWQIIKNDATYSDAGVHIFAGVVADVSSSFNGSKYTVSVSCKDNMYYLDMGQTNFKPSVDVYNKGIYDPLTPFDLQFNSVSGLDNGELPDFLPENKNLLLKKITKAKSGRNRGVTYTEDLYKSFDGTPSSGGNKATQYIRTLYDPDGFVYRWKKGIGTLLLFDNKSQQRLGQDAPAPGLTVDPWAGQDVMNVMSLLITGYPYNYNNFIKGAIANSNLGVDTQFNENTATSYYRSLISDLRKNNSVWGNFLPFKSLVLNEKALSFLLSTQVEVTQANAKVNSLLNNIAAFEDRLFASGGGAGTQPALDSTGNPVSPEQASIKINKQKISKEIEFSYKQITDLNLEIQEKLILPNLTDGLQFIGDDASFDPDYDPSSNKITPREKERERMELRKNLLLLSQRRLWQTKANEDKNYFIVDDQYDKNYDIQAFSRALSSNLQLLNSEYSSVKQKVVDVAKILGLEVFADTQGNIRVQPPGYNKVPSSVYYRMLVDRNKGKRIFPKELEDIFLQQNKTLTKDIEIIEDKIRLYLTALGADNDSVRERLLTGTQYNKNQDSFAFKFVTDSNYGKFALEQNFDATKVQANPDFKQRYESLPLKKNLDTQIKSRGLFDFIKKATIFNSKESNTLGLKKIIDVDLKKEYNIIRRRLQAASGFVEPTIETFASNNGAGQSQIVTGSAFLNLLNQVSALVIERQTVLKKLDSNLSNIDQSQAVNGDPKVAKSILLPNLFGKEDIPDLLSHMIEDESVDDLGDGSGKRYVLTDSQISSFTLKENPPDYTHIEVTGRFAEGLAGGDLGVTQGGNELSTAYAVDYDMWRMYGFRTFGNVSAPYLTDPVSQLAPFAVYLLNRARRNVLNATATIVGNEFMQPGEVVYVESYDLLFYIETVQHSYAPGSNWSTNLTLSYGHPVGEYIPTMLDVIGKSLYSKNFSSSAIQTDRSNNADGSQSIGIVTIVTGDNDLLSASPLQKILKGTYGNQNVETLKRVFTLFQSNISASTRPVLNARIYYGKSFQDGAELYPEYLNPDSDLLEAAQSIYDWLITPREVSDGEIITVTGTDAMGKSKNQGLQLDKSQFKAYVVEATDEFSPSAKAHARTREMNNGTDEVGNLFKYIIDLWVTFEDKPTTSETGAGSSQGTSQAGNANSNAADAGLKKTGR